METPLDAVEKEVAKILEVFNRICDEIAGERKGCGSRKSDSSPKKRSRKDDQNH